MILPDKHTTLKYSILGQGGDVLRALSRPIASRTLFEKVRKNSTISNYERFLLVVAFLFSIGCVEERGGLLIKVKR